jgi:protein gp37
MSKIQWTDLSINPIHLVNEDGSHGGHWCNKDNSECANCYSEAQNQSGFFGFASHLKYTGKVPENMILNEKVMQEVVRMRTGKKIFVCSMTDLFGDWIPDEWIDKIFAYMALAHQHTFQVLTKRDRQMHKYFTVESAQRVSRLYHQLILDGVAGKKRQDYAQRHCFHHDVDKWWPLPNVWLGVSAGTQKSVDEKVQFLVDTPAKVKFLSCEPLLENIQFSNLDNINLVIIGGESGPHARVCHIENLRSLGI